MEKSNGSTGTIYWYMSPGIVGESDLGANLQSEYVFFDGERVARKDLPGDAVSYYFSDHLKTASVVTDSSGNIKEDEDYYPWGGELQFVNNDANHYKFTGKERDGETGLDYFGARYYGNWLGRWMSPDWAAKPEAVPYSDLGDPQSLNLYSYVRNVPTSRADVDGHHCPPDCDVKVDMEMVKQTLRQLGPAAGPAIGTLGPAALLAVPPLAATLVAIKIEPTQVNEDGCSGPQCDMFYYPSPTTADNKSTPAQQPQLGQGRGADEDKSQSDIANDRTRTNGGIAYSSDFGNNLKQDLNPGQKNSVDIQYTGSRSDDAVAANTKAGFKTTPKGYTWHHVANYNAKTNTGTMQLIERKAHKKFHHGGVKQWEDAHKKKYKP